LLQQRSRHPRKMVVTLKASTSRFTDPLIITLRKSMRRLVRFGDGRIWPRAPLQVGTFMLGGWVNRTQRATHYTARSNIEPAQIVLHANGQSAPRSGGVRDVGRGAGSHTPSTALESFSHLTLTKRRR